MQQWKLWLKYWCKVMSSCRSKGNYTKFNWKKHFPKHFPNNTHTHSYIFSSTVLNEFKAMTAKNIKHKWFDICQKSTNVLKHCFVWLISHDFIKDFTIKLDLWSQDHLSFLIWVNHVETKCFSFRSFLVKHMPALAWHSKALAYDSYLNKWITFVISFLSTLAGDAIVLEFILA